MAKRCNVRILVEPADEINMASFYCETTCVVFSQQISTQELEGRRVCCPRCNLADYHNPKRGR